MTTMAEKSKLKKLGTNINFQPVFDGDSIVGVNLVEYFPQSGIEHVLKCFVDMDAFVGENMSDDCAAYLNESLFD